MSPRPALPAMIFGLLCGLFAAQPACAQSLRLTSDAPVVRADGNVYLTLEGDGLEAMPDLAPLFADAREIGITTGARLTLRAGRVVELRSWRIIAHPEHAGTLRFGPIAAGDAVSEAVDVEVRETPPRWLPDAGDISLEADVSSPHPYVQQNVIYRLRLTTLHKLAAQSLQAPELARQHGRPLGPERHLERPGGGETIEQEFAVSFDTSGAAILPGGAATATIVRADGMRANVALAAPALDVAVRPWPDTVRQIWLPAQNVTLSETWSIVPDALHAGEITTRTITAIAEGVDAAQLPDLALPPTRGIAIVAAPVQRRNLARPGNPGGQGLPAGEAVYRFDLRVLSPGPIFLDPVHLPWWNLGKDAGADALLPARRFDAARPDVAGLPDDDARQNLWLQAGQQALRNGAGWALAGLAVAGLAVLAGVTWSRRKRAPGWLVAMRRGARRADAAAFYRGYADFVRLQRNSAGDAAGVERALFAKGGSKVDRSTLRQLARACERNWRKRSVTDGRRPRDGLPEL